MELQLFNISPRIPKELLFLETLSYNMWWCWHPQAADLFFRLDPGLWKEVQGNSRKFLSLIPQARLEELAKDPGYLRHLKAVQMEFEREVTPDDMDFAKRTVAYFSMEYGIHESVRIFSGGLGILSGDHVKAASDLHLPFAAVGLLYRQGYFRQVLDRNGWQMERYPENEIHNMPLRRAVDANGQDLVISFPLKDRELYAAVWILWTGNIPLVLLDTEIAENPPEFREITWRLYGGDRDMRIKQELLLGVGGYKALAALGMKPQVCHMNEGHASFMSLARLEELVNEGLDPDSALEHVWRTNIFTTHTPVPAGNEAFPMDQLRPYLKPLAERAHIDVERLMRWGIPIAERETSQEVSMTILGLRLANYSNGVSKLHGEVARNMWKHLWPNRSVSEIPIGHITNGVHVTSWIASRIRTLFDRYMPQEWAHNPSAIYFNEAVNSIPDDELWAAHEQHRHSLIRKARQIAQRGIGAPLPGQAVSSLLDPDILTIGFARRFATYKRGTLLLRDPERLVKLLTHKQRPVQFVFAGKAHPADEGGKKLIQDLIQFARQYNVQDRLIFLEDYDIALARDLVQGVDVWLNNPRRPQEASGTSGMKAAINGVINCSILDGWWDEAYAQDNTCGWAIQGNPNLTNDEDADNFEANSLYSLLSNEIIPCFYERDTNDIPVRWIQRMKQSIIMSLGFFSSERMVAEYDSKFYQPACQACQELIKDNRAKARALVAQKKEMLAHFGELWIGNLKTDRPLDDIHVGDTIKLTAEVYFGELPPETLDVEAYYGPVNIHNEVLRGASCLMHQVKKFDNAHFLYECELVCDVEPGRFGLTARITPAGEDWNNSVPGFTCWAR